MSEEMSHNLMTVPGLLDFQSSVRVAHFPKIIGLCGKMGSGKDSAGAMLSMVGYNCVSWATALRLEAFNSLCQRIPPPGMSPEVRQSWCMMEAEDIYRKPTSGDARKVLQFWGTELRRSKDPDYWIRALHSKLNPDTLYAITDCRFDNECRYVQEHGGSVWMVQRPDASQPAGIAEHASEKFEGINPNKYIYNTGSLIDLAKNIKIALGMLV